MAISRVRLTIMSLINTCFRDIAEYDYIAARVLFRNELYHQFLWAALQSLEKFLKAILLYNDIPVKSISHRPHGLLEIAKKSLPQLQPIVDPSTEEFIKHIETYGNFRYLENTYVVLSKWLSELDKSVWYLRRFAFFMDYLRPENDPQGIDRFSQYIEYAQNSDRLDYPYRYQFFSKSPILTISESKNKNPRMYSNLCWRNPYFGKRNKKRIWMQQFSRFHKPTHLIQHNISSELIQWIGNHIRMSSEIVKYLSEISSMMKP